jgi:hypothetical protein
MANLFDRKALQSIFDVANDIRRSDQRPEARDVAVYLAKEDETGSKPPALVAAAHNAMHAAAVKSFGGRLVKEVKGGLVAVFGDPFDALRAGLHALHAIDLMGEVLVLRGSHVAIGHGKAELTDGALGEIKGPAYDRATKILSRAAMGEVVLEQALLASMKPLKYGDVEVMQPRKGKLPVLGNVTTVAVRPLMLNSKLGDDMEEVDSELRSRGRR